MTLCAMEPITIRLANAADAPALERVAQLDSRPLPPGPHLVGLTDGRIDALISLPTRAVVADPFLHTAAPCELLRCAARRRSLPGRRLAPIGTRHRAAWAPT
jgi:hypothetical protein